MSYSNLTSTKRKSKYLNKGLKSKKSKVDKSSRLNFVPTSYLKTFSTRVKQTEIVAMNGTLEKNRIYTTKRNTSTSKKY